MKEMDRWKKWTEDRNEQISKRNGQMKEMDRWNTHADQRLTEMCMVLNYF